MDYEVFHDFVSTLLRSTLPQNLQAILTMEQTFIAYESTTINYADHGWDTFIPPRSQEGNAI